MGHLRGVPALAALLGWRRDRRARVRLWLAFGLSMALVMTLADFAVPRPAQAQPVAEPAATVKCPESRPDRTSALLAARLCEGKVLVDEFTSETAQVWANANGTMTAEVHSGVVRVP